MQEVSLLPAKTQPLRAQKHPNHLSTDFAQNEAKSKSVSNISVKLSIHCKYNNNDHWHHIDIEPQTSQNMDFIQNMDSIQNMKTSFENISPCD